MKKNTLYILFILCTSVCFKLKGQTTTGYWLNPLNDVPFLVEYQDSTSINDSSIVVFNGETTFEIDSFGTKIWNPISEVTYQAIVGYNAPSIVLNATLSTYYDLLVIGINPVLDSNFWDITAWDTLIDIEPWIDDRTINLTSADMGAIVAWDWYNMDLESAKIILDPTVPVIEGEDMDFIDIDQGINMAFDIDDYKTYIEEITWANNNVFVFNKPDFKDTYNDFVEWMKETKPFFPHTFDFDTYHEWLYEYFHGIAEARITEILSTDDVSIQIDLFRVSRYTYQATGDFVNSPYTIIDLQGKRVQTGVLNSNNNIIHLDQLPKGIYFIDIGSMGKHTTYKLIR